MKVNTILWDFESTIVSHGISSFGLCSRFFLPMR